MLRRPHLGRLGGLCQGLRVNNYFGEGLKANHLAIVVELDQRRGR